MMTPEQQWQAAVVLSKQLAKKPTALDKGIIWADNRIKTLEREVTELKYQKADALNVIADMAYGEKEDVARRFKEYINSRQTGWK